MELTKKINALTEELKDLGYIGMRIDKWGLIEVHMSGSAKLEKLELPIEFALNKYSGSYPHEIYSIKDEVKFFQIISNKELATRFPEILKDGEEEAV